MSVTIQLRRGLLTNIPEPLFIGELGFTIDSNQLFIGDGIFNHEILMLENLEEEMLKISPPVKEIENIDEEMAIYRNQVYDINDSNYEINELDLEKMLFFTGNVINISFKDMCIEHGARVGVFFMGEGICQIDMNGYYIILCQYEYSIFIWLGDKWLATEQPKLIKNVSSITDNIKNENGYIYGGHGYISCAEYLSYIDTWVAKTDMPSPNRYYLSASTINKKGYIYGGYSGGTLQDCDEYDPDTWTSKTDMPSPGRYRFAASTINDKGYIYGGYSYLQDCDEYDPDTWTSKADLLNYGRQYLAASTINDKGYIYGGYGGSSYLQDCDEYDPSLNIWTSKLDMPLPARQFLAATTIKNKGYIYGGHDGSSYLQDCDEYDPDTWTSKTDMLVAGGQGCASTIDNKGYHYYNRTCTEYDTDADNWTAKADMLENNYNYAASTI